MTVQATSASKKRVEREELTGLQRESWRLKEERETLTKPRPVVRRDGAWILAQQARGVLPAREGYSAR